MASELTASEMARKRWKGTTKAERSEHGQMMSEARNAKVGPDERKEIARKAGLASAAARKKKGVKRARTTH